MIAPRYLNLLPSLLLLTIVGAGIAGQLSVNLGAHLIAVTATLIAVGWGLDKRQEAPIPIALALLLPVWMIGTGFLHADGDLLAFGAKSLSALVAAVLVARVATLTLFWYVLAGIVVAQLPWVVGQAMSADPNDFVRGWFLDSNSLAAFASLAAFGLLASTQRLSKWHALTLLLVVVVWLGPMSKGAILALLGLGWMALVAWSMERTNSRTIKVAAWSGPVILVGGGTAFFWESLAKIAASPSIQDRIGMWGSSWSMYLDGNLLLGRGLGSWGQLYPSYRTVRDTESAGTFAHSDFVQFLVEGGPVALVLYTLITGFVIARLFSGMRTSWREKRVTSETYAVAGVAVFLVHSTVNFLVITPALTVGVGALLGLALQNHKGRVLTLPVKSAIGLIVVAAFALHAWHIGAHLSRAATSSPNSWPAQVLPMLQSDAVISYFAKPGHPLLFSFTARADLSFRYVQLASTYTDAQQAESGVSRRQLAETSLAILRKEDWPESKELARQLLEATLLGAMVESRLLPADDANSARLIALVNDAEKSAPYHVMAVRAKAEALRLVRGCPASIEYRKQMIEKLPVYVWKKRLSHEMATGKCGGPSVQR